MKKQYATLALDIVSLHTTEIIVTSTYPLGLGQGPSNGTMQYGKQRNPIWGDDE